MSDQLIALPAKNFDEDYKTYFEYAYYNFIECLLEGERLGIDFSEEKINLKDALDKIMNYDNM